MQSRILQVTHLGNLQPDFSGISSMDDRKEGRKRGWLASSRLTARLRGCAVHLGRMTVIALWLPNRVGNT
jgi:hypothetical protein